MSLFGQCGSRKYLTPSEREVFATEARKKDPKTKSLCLILLWTGIRISEALNLKASNVDLNQKLITIESLKKRKRGVYRQVPISDELASELKRSLPLLSQPYNEGSIWSFSRRTASRRIKSVMKACDISGIHACPKGLRHSFAVYSVLKGIPLVLLKKWMGHAYLQTTEIYLNIIGNEERSIAQKLWSS